MDVPLTSTATLTGGGKVWLVQFLLLLFSIILSNISYRSTQNPGSVHIAPLGGATTTFVPTSTGDGKTVHEPTVHITQGQLNLADPLKTHILQPEQTSGQIAEAAAASAFEFFPPDTPLTSPSTTYTIFTPNISSTDLYSSASAPSAQFKYGLSSNQDTKSTKTDSSSTNKTTGSNEIPTQRESDLRDEILRESLKYVNEKGWTMEAIRAGVRASNQPTTVEGLFSNGYDLVEYFMRNANGKMVAYMIEKSKK